MNINNENIDDNNEEEERFSDDPEEQLRIENELLRLQLQAETGADIHQLSDVPPEVENAFLNNILAFERQLDNLEEETIFKIIGEPADFKKEAELSDEEIEKELPRLMELMKEKGIEVDYGMEYPDRLKYKFVTEELFEHETQKFDIPDMVNHFIYEEFHPNYKLEMDNLAGDFLEKWLSQNIEEDSWELAEEWIGADKETKYTKSQVLDRIQHIFDAYLRFEHGSFNIEESFFEEQPEGASIQATGVVEGNISYDAVLESKEVQHISEAFTLCLKFENGNWEIYSMALPGLEL